MRPQRAKVGIFQKFPQSLIFPPFTATKPLLSCLPAWEDQSGIGEDRARYDAEYLGPVDEPRSVEWPRHGATRRTVKGLSYCIFFLFLTFFKGTMSPAAIERVTMNERELLEDISSDSGDPQSTVSRRRHSYENTTTRVKSPPVRRRAPIQIKQEIISDDEEPLQAGPSPSAPSNSANRRGRGRPPRKSLPAMMIASPKAPPTPRKKSPPRRRQSPDSDALSVELLPHVPAPRPPPPPPSPTRKRSTAKKAPAKRERKRITIKQEPQDDYMEESDTTESVARWDQISLLNFRPNFGRARLWA